MGFFLDGAEVPILVCLSIPSQYHLLLAVAGVVLGYVSMRGAAGSVIMGS